MARKGLCVWFFSSLTFMSLVHLIDAVSALVFNTQVHLPQLYPFIGEELQTIAPTTYLWASGVATLVFWGLTCGIAFDNPVEKFLNLLLSDVKRQSAEETRLVTDKSEVLDAMCETMESSGETIDCIRDMMCNIRADVKQIQPLSESIEKMKGELGHLKKEVETLEKTGIFPFVCSTCGRHLSPDFRLCPYCGEKTSLFPEKAASLQAYR
jgi:rubrerythrin